MRKIHLLLPLLLLLCILISGCHTAAYEMEPPGYASQGVLFPSADGKEVIGISPISLDISNTDQGYFIAQSTDIDKKINIQLTGPDNIVYSYFLSPGETAVLPFTSGSGFYQILCYQQILDEQYAALFSEVLEIQLDNPFLPFLYPNQYVNFSSESKAVVLASGLLSENATDLEILSAIYHYVTETITYDYDKAFSVEAGYLPDIDETLESKTGICFDYAALMTAMLRSRGIPCKLQIGYTKEQKHAWIDVYIHSKGWIDQAISFDGKTWKLLDPTFEAAASDTFSFFDEVDYIVQFSR